MNNTTLLPYEYKHKRYGLLTLRVILDDLEDFRNWCAVNKYEQLEEDAQDIEKQIEALREGVREEK